MAATTTYRRRGRPRKDSLAQVPDEAPVENEDIPEADPETVEIPAPEVQARNPNFPPPGRTNRGEHGYQGGRIVVKVGSALLRDVLQLNADVPIESLCDDAARVIEDLRRGKGVRCPKCSE